VKPGAGALPDTTGSRSRATEGGRCRSASSNEFQIFRPQAPCRSVDRERYSIARLQFCAVRHVHGVYVDVRLGCFVAVNSGEAKFEKIVTPSSPVGARSSTRCGRLRSSSKAGGITTTPSTRMLRSATGHPHRKSSCLHSPRGRLRYADRHRRPRLRYRQLLINIPPGPLNAGRSIRPAYSCQCTALDVLVTSMPLLGPVGDEQAHVGC
jgi:hypothetical protein